MSVAGRLGQAVATEAARAAELLLRLSPAPRGLSYLASYRQAFTSRYGHDREVPLLELLNPHRGLGPPSMHGHAHVGPDPAKAAQRAQTLLRLACGALHNRERAILLDDDALTRLETWRPDPKTAPLSLDINILVAARSAAAIDSGDFTVVVWEGLPPAVTWGDLQACSVQTGCQLCSRPPLPKRHMRRNSCGPSLYFCLPICAPRTS